MASVNWPLGGTQQLTFEVYNCSKSGWNNFPGLYIFCYEKEGFWRPVYVGQTNNFQERIPSHERFDDAVRYGATHIHAVVVRTQAQRDELEQALIHALQPPLNVQNKGLGSNYLRTLLS